MRRMFFVLSVLFFGQASAQSDVELARRAREILSHPQYVATFSTEMRCVQTKPAKKEKGKNTEQKEKCRRVLKATNVFLGISRGDDQFVVINVAGSGPLMCASKTAEFDTKCYVNSLGETNGMNTEFEIVKPENYKVYGITRAYNGPDGPAKGVYTPYSDRLNTPPVRQAGKEYIDSVIDKAISELRVRGVSSHIDPNRLVADLASKDIVRRLVLIEHIDVYRFLRESVRDLANEVYVTYGLNQENAYNFSRSSVDANGMFQIIPATYYMVLDQYPAANLNRDFGAGTKDHVNAAIAAILLIDYNIGKLPKTLRAVMYKHSLEGDYVSSSYNGKQSRPFRLLKAKQDFVKHNDNFENKHYIMKMRAVANLPF
jgi:hypothetical protein